MDRGDSFGNNRTRLGIRDKNRGDAATTVTLGENGFEYWTSGLNWGDLPGGWVYKEGTSVAIDTNDQVYVFNRGTCPMIVFDTDRKILRTWEKVYLRIRME